MYTQLLMGPKAEAREDKCLWRAQIDADMGQSIRTPSRNIPLASNLGPWGLVVIKTANQAQNVWHTTLIEGNIYAIRFLHDFNRVHQDCTIQQMEGGHILMRSFPLDSQYL